MNWLRRCSTWVLHATLACCGTTGWARAAYHRVDVTDAFAQQLCNYGAERSLPVSYWHHGIFDAQVDSEILASKTGAEPSIKSLERRAKAMARLRNAGGFAYGLCDDGYRGWIASMPSPEPMRPEAGATVVRLPHAALSATCRSFRVDFAAAKVAAFRQIRVLDQQNLNVGELGPGVVSVTCLPKAPLWRGPVLWFLYPIDMKDGDQPPGAELLPAGQGPQDKAEAILSWINKLRSDQKLAPLHLSPSLSEAAARLSVDHSVDHNRAMLNGSADLLMAKNIKLLSEDRVRAERLRSMAWLLWFSPRHRESLLIAEADLVGIHLSIAGSQHLGVLLFGKTLPMPASRALNTNVSPATNSSL